MAAEIPEKLYFKIGEVAALLDVKTHVLRYWETEFALLQPVKSRTNQRLYRRQDIDTALLIKDLLYRQGFTIAGARNQLAAELQSKESSSPDTESAAAVLKQVKSDLQRLQRRLSLNQSVD